MLAKGLFKRPGQRVDSIKNRDIFSLDIALGQLLRQLQRDRVRFFALRPAFHDPGQVPRWAARQQFLFLPPPIVADHPVGNREDLGCTPIVFLQPHDLGAGIVSLEIEDILDRRSPPTVNRLIRVASHGQIRVVDIQHADNAVLSRIGVLIFVDHHEAMNAIVVLPDFQVVPEQSHHVQQQVVEIDGIRDLQLLLISGIHFGDDLAKRTTGPWLKRIRRDT